MKNKWAVKWLVILMTWFSLSVPALSTTFVQTNMFILDSGETLDSELWLMASQITLNGNAKDDLFLMAVTSSLWDDDNKDGLVKLAGEYDNDVWAMGNTVELTGKIQDHARFLARTITINGSIAHSSIFIGNTLHLAHSAAIAADAWMMGENLIIEGDIKGNVNLMGKEVTLSGTFGQDVFVTAQDLVVLPGTKIRGNLTYRCPKELVFDRRVVIQGRVIRKMMPESSSGRALESFFYQSWLFMGALMVAMIFIALLPAFTNRAIRGIRSSPGKCMVTGLMVMCLVPLAVFFALLSIIGIPLGLLLMATAAILVYLSKIVVAMALGTWILRRPEPHGYTQYLLPLVSGLLLVYAGVNSGMFGLVVWLIVTTTGAGALVLALLPANTGSATLLKPDNSFEGSCNQR